MTLKDRLHNWILIFAMLPLYASPFIAVWTFWVAFDMAGWPGVAAAALAIAWLGALVYAADYVGKGGR